MSKTENKVESDSISAESISFNFNITYKQEGSNESVTVGDSVHLPLNDERELNKILTEKPYAAQIAPALWSFIKQSHDPDNVLAKNLKDSIK